MSLQDKLRTLFLLDQQVRGLRSRLDSALAHQKAQNTKLDRLNQQLSEKQEQYKHDQVLGQTLEHQLREIDLRVSQLREKMNNVRSNKEYSALLVEVNTLKVEKGKVEEVTLQQMSKVESQNNELIQLKDKIEQQKKLMNVAQTEVKDRESEISARLTELNAQRDAADKELPADARQTYNRLAVVHDGEHMANVIEESRRLMEYSCGGCYMSIPVERVNTLMMRDEIVCCPSCNRILYMDEELKASMGVQKNR